MNFALTGRQLVRLSTLLGLEGEAASHRDKLVQLAKQLDQLDQLPKIVCLIGSAKFNSHFKRAQLDESLAGHIVLTLGQTDKQIEWPIEIKDNLDTLHLFKIQLADEVFILNVGDYMGLSTIREYQFARLQGKPIRWLEPHFAENELREVRVAAQQRNHSSST